MPAIGFTTNGTIIHDELIALLRSKPYLKVSVSVDGPSPIHDRFRVDPMGRPTYRRVIDNIHVLRRDTGRPGMLELTYSTSHLQSGMSLWDVMEAIHRDSGVGMICVEIAYNTPYSGSVFDPLQIDLDLTKNDLCAAIRKSMRDIASSSDPTYFYQVVAFAQTLFQHNTPHACPAGRHYFTVAQDGGIYPCQNLPENSRLLIARLGDRDLRQKISNNSAMEVVGRANANANRAVGDKWYARFCKVCPAHNLSETGTLDACAPARANVHEHMAFAFLTELVRIAENGADYRAFVKNVARTQDEAFQI